MANLNRHRYLFALWIRYDSFPYDDLFFAMSYTSNNFLLWYFFSRSFYQKPSEISQMKFFSDLSKSTYFFGSVHIHVNFFFLEASEIFAAKVMYFLTPRFSLVLLNHVFRPWNNFGRLIFFQTVVYLLGQRKVFCWIRWLLSTHCVSFVLLKIFTLGLGLSVYWNFRLT